MFLGYDVFPIRGQSGRDYNFHADPIDFSAPAEPAVFFVVRMLARLGRDPDTKLLYLGRGPDLASVVADRRRAYPEANMVFWLPAPVDALAPIQLDLSSFLPAAQQDPLVL